MNRRVEATPPECALAAEMFDHFCSAGTMKQILALHREICNTLNLRPNRLPDFYPKLKEKLTSSWKAQALFKKFDLRANHKVYGKGRACTQNKVLIIGAGPCGLRAAIECQLLGAKVVVIEKRDRMSRNNVLHLWPFVIQDLRALGAKKFFGKFCAGSIDHISIRQLQCILLKVSLLLGVEFHEGVSFEELLEPTVTENNESVGWRARVLPSNHPVSMYEFDALVGADGKRNTLHGFKRKEFRGKLAMAITANFINRHTEQEASVPEISGVAFIFNQKFFKELYEVTGIDLENIVYYKDDTHYFVMTAKKHSLLDKGVLLNDYNEVSRLLSVENVDRAALMRYAQEAARFSTGGRLPLRDFALNHYGEPDVALFDFTSMYAAENASIVHERHGRRVLCQLVGDSLLEPFWPTGSGCARGFLSALDAAWAVRSWGHTPTPHPLHVIAERESIYRLLAQTTPENLHRDLGAYTLDPCTRYPNLNRAAVSPHRVTGFYDADEPLPLDAASTQRKRRRETDVPDEVLAAWVGVPELRAAASPPALAAAVRRYRPDLLPHAAPPTHVYHVLHQELGIPLPASINGGGSVREVPEGKVRSYLSRVYAAFKGEVPHIHHASDVFHQLKQQTDRHLNNDHSISAYSNAAETDKSHSSYKRKRRARAEEGRIVGGGGRTSGGGGARVARLAAELAGQPAPAPTPPRPSKPKDLMRSVGKIERDDWNMREIERKIMENRLGRPEPRAAEKVPKWDREQFLGRQRKLKEGDGSDEKWGEIDETLHKFDQKLRDSGRPDHGTKKVANLATKFVKKDPVPEPVKIQTHKEEVKKSWRGPMTSGVQCTACGTRVFAAEGVTADGLTLHRACFRCAVCRAMLRPGNYTMERYGSRLVCLRHGGIAPGASVPDAAPTTAPLPPTPERISLELSDSGAREIDEDEWTDRNCLASETSAANNVSDEEDSSSDEYTDAGESDVAPARSPSPQRIPARAHTDIYFSDDSFGYDDYSDDGGESSGGESCSRMRALREARRREVPAEARPPTDSSEVESEEESSSEEESASSATEVSTDSEFARDEGHLPAILVTPAPPPTAVIVPAIVAPPAPREYPLSRALSAGGLATQRALELKRRYLLGEPSPPAVRKSDSTSQIDSKLAAFTNNITEFQKMLNPAAAPAPTPTVATAYHAKIDPKPMPDIIKNLCGAAPLDLLAKTEPSLIHDYISERSEPGSESAKLDPEDDDGLESDSLSDRTERESSRAPVPRLEVHDDSGELVHLDSLTSGAVTAPTVLPASTPAAAGEDGSSSSREASTLALTESSASSWAGEGSALEAAGAGRRAAPRHLARPKSIRAATDHVCGRSDRDTDPGDAVRFENASDHFAFADEGEGEPEPVLVVNRGYMELVDDEYSPTRDRSMDFIERAFSETVYRQTPPASLPAPAPEIVHTLPPDLDSEQLSPTKTETESSEKTVADSESRSRGETSSVGLEPSLESLSLSSVTSPPLASPSDSGEAEAARMERVRRERDHQTEVVRRLVLARLGGERAPRRRPRPPAHPSAPPPVPPPPVQAPPSPAPVTPAFSDPELARASPRRNTIMRTISVYINRHLHPKHKQEPISRVNVAHKSTGALQEVPQEAPPVPPPPAGYCPPPDKTCYRPVASSKIPVPCESDRDAMQLFEVRWAKLVAQRRARDLCAPPTTAPARRLAKLERRLSRPLSAEQQAAKVAELVQVLATRDAHQSLMKAELIRRSATSGGEMISVPLPAGSSLHEARSVRPTHDK